MTDLAFDVNGEPFELPATAAFWRVRRFRNTGTRGAPEVVFGRDGLPLILPIDTELAEFRDQVDGMPGRYRLDPIDERHRPVSGLPAAYLQISDPPRATTGGAGEDHAMVIRELARANADMAKTIADKFAAVMQSAADLLRAADGAGLPARTPPAPETRNVALDTVTDDAEEKEEEPRSEFLAEIVKQVMPLVRAVVMRMLDGRGSGDVRNTAAASTEAEGAEADHANPTGGAGARKAASSAQRDLLAHLRAIENALTPAEVDLVRRAMGEMSPEVLQAWAAKLCTLSVEEAVRAVRAEMAKGGGS